MATIAERLAEAAVTDSLNRTENPLSSSGAWAILNPGTTTGRCQATAGQEGWTAATSFATGEDDAYWTKEPFVSSATKLIYGIFTLTRLGANERQTGIWLCRDKTNPKETKNGYLFKIERTATLIKYRLIRVVAGVEETLKEVETGTYGAGSQFAIVVGNGKVYMFARETPASGPYEEVLSASDSTYTEGYSGLRAKGTGEMVAKDFRTGTFTLYSGEYVRQFSHSPSSEIVTSNGSITGGELTLVAIIKYEEDGNIAKTVNALNEDIEPNPQLAINLGGLLSHGTSVSPSFKPPKGTWCLVAYTKYPGTNKPRQHMYDFTTKTWTHAEASSARGEGTPAEWGKWRIGGKTSAVGPYKGAIAAVARFTKVLSDDQIERLVNAEAIGAWTAMTPAPVMLWEFGQSAASQELKDLVGTANQTSLVETTALEESPPMKYGTLGERVGKYVKVLAGGALQEVKRWIMVGGSLVSK